MKTIYSSIVAATLAIGASSAVAATSLSEYQAATVCHARAASQYADGARTAHVTFKGVYGGTDRLRVRMQVLPAEGKAFLAICEVSRNARALVALAPTPRGIRPARVVQVVAVR